MPVLELDILANAAYFLFLLSFIMRDILWLRVFTIAALLFETPYFYFQVEPLWPAIAWNAAFAAINIYWITRLLIERRPVHFTPDEQRLYETALRAMRPRHARKLFRGGVWRSVDLGEAIAVQGKPLNELSLIAQGNFTVEKNGRVVEEIGEGRFAGCSNFMQAHKDWPAPVTYKAAKPSRLVYWRHDKLRLLIADDPELTMAVEASLGLELARFLENARGNLEHMLSLVHRDGQ